MSEQSDRPGWRTWLGGITVGLVVIALLIAAYSVGFSEGEDEGLAERGGAQPAAREPAVPSGPGRQLFASTCGSCHTLAAAGTDGKVGPDLDQLRPDVPRVLAAIEKGGAGTGGMPPGLLSGERARQVAEFVAAAAGR